jgi:FtsH-binding integral membrane protein
MGLIGLLIAMLVPQEHRADFVISAAGVLIRRPTAWDTQKIKGDVIRMRTARRRPQGRDGR